MAATTLRQTPERGPGLSHQRGAGGRGDQTRNRGVAAESRPVRLLARIDLGICTTSAALDPGAPSRRYTIPCHTLPCHAIPCHAMPCHTYQLGVLLPQKLALGLCTCRRHFKLSNTIICEKNRKNNKVPGMGCLEAGFRVAHMYIRRDRNLLCVLVCSDTLKVFAGHPPSDTFKGFAAPWPLK